MMDIIGPERSGRRKLRNVSGGSINPRNVYWFETPELTVRFHFSPFPSRHVLTQSYFMFSANYNRTHTTLPAPVIMLSLPLSHFTPLRTLTYFAITVRDYLPVYLLTIHPRQNAGRSITHHA